MINNLKGTPPESRRSSMREDRTIEKLYIFPEDLALAPSRTRRVSADHPA
jgi:hypothetical protein